MLSTAAQATAPAETTWLAWQSSLRAWQAIGRHRVQVLFRPGLLLLLLPPPAIRVEFSILIKTFISKLLALILINLNTNYAVVIILEKWSAGGGDGGVLWWCR